MTWRKLLPLLLLIVPCGTFAKGAPEQKGLYDFSKGLDSYHSSLSLPDGFVQGSLNGFFDARAPFEKRQGFTASWSVNTSTVIVITQGVNNQFAIRVTGIGHSVTVPAGTYVSGAALATAANSAITSQTVFSDSFTFTGTNFQWSSSAGHILQASPAFSSPNFINTIGFNTQGTYIAGSVAPAPPVITRTGSPYQNLWTYTDQTNITWQIVRSSVALYADNLSGAPAVLIATVSAGNLVGETNAFGNAYFVDQSQGVYYWNGSSTAYISGSPFGSIITQFHNRLWVTGAAPPNGNQLYGSALYNGLVWTPNLNPNDPVQLIVGIQDNFDNITALYVYLDTLYVFKHYATYGLYGFDQTSFQVSQITQECGCVDGGSIQTYGGDLKFVSLRGVEDFNGYTCNRISDPIKNLVDSAIQIGNASAQSWVQSQTSDWLAGSISQLSTSAFSPALALVNVSTQIQNNSFENSFTNWTAQSNWSNVSSASGIFCCNAGCADGGPVTAFNGTQFALDTVPQSGSNPMAVSLVYSSNTASVISSETITLSSVNCGYSQFNLPFSGASGTSVNLIFTDSSGNSLTSDPFPASANTVTFELGQDVGAGSTILFHLDFISGNPSLVINYSSGTFRSQIHNIPAITSWGNFSAQDILSGGGDAIVFSICSSTNSNMSAPSSCAAQTVNSQITIATGPYVQWYATFTVTSATQTPTLNNGTVQWFTGARATPMSSTIWDNRYWLSITTMTSDTANDAVVVLAKTGAWSLLDIHAGGFTQYKNSLYHSDSQPTGNVYLDNQGYSDNGNPINAYLLTKDYPIVNLAQDASVQAIYPTFTDQSNANISLSYFIDRNPTQFSLSSVNQSEYLNTSSLKIPMGAGSEGLDNQVFGETFSFLIQQNDSNPMQFFGMRVLFSEREIQ